MKSVNDRYPSILISSLKTECGGMRSHVGVSSTTKCGENENVESYQ